MTSELLDCKVLLMNSLEKVFMCLTKGRPKSDRSVRLTGKRSNTPKVLTSEK